MKYIVRNPKWNHSNQTSKRGHLFSFKTLVHTHIHKKEHAHVHNESNEKKITPWLLFIIFIFGPCEVLIPLLMFPAAQNHFGILVAVTLAFAITTIGTMSLLVTFELKGIRLIHSESFEKYTHEMAGATILMCGIAIRFPGL
jgi:nickel/cobalt transporter (NicO) family protein